MEALGLVGANESARHAVVTMTSRKLGYACAQQVRKLVQAEADDILISYPLRTACRRELRRFCSDVATVQGQGLACLEAHLSQRDFSEECARATHSTVSVLLQDYRLMPQVRKHCHDYVGTHCANASEGETATGEAGALACLLRAETAAASGPAVGPGVAGDGTSLAVVGAAARGGRGAAGGGGGSAGLTQSCGLAVRDAARSAFLHFEWGRGVTQQCDADIYDKCTGSRHDVNADGRFSGPETWTCMQRAAHEQAVTFRSEPCLRLVRLLAPHQIVDGAQATALTDQLRRQHEKLLLEQQRFQSGLADALAAKEVEALQHARARDRLGELQQEVAAKAEQMTRLKEQLAFSAEVSLFVLPLFKSQYCHHYQALSLRSL